MTLLIGTLIRSRKPCIVITADGRCTGFDGVTHSVRSNSYQKIFPIADVPIVFAHHGENIIVGNSVKEFLYSFMQQKQPRSSDSLEGIADNFEQYAADQCKATLRQIPTSKIIGFWISGFGLGSKQPRLLEIGWKKEGASGQIALEKKVHGDLVFGGDAQRFVNRFCTQPVDGMFSWDRLRHENMNYAVKFHTKLYGLAESAQAAEQSELFGGHQHQIHITPAGWHWIIPPLDAAICR